MSRREHDSLAAFGRSAPRVFSVIRTAMACAAWILQGSNKEGLLEKWSKGKVIFSLGRYQCSLLFIECLPAPKTSLQFQRLVISQRVRGGARFARSQRASAWRATRDPAGAPGPGPALCGALWTLPACPLSSSPQGDLSLCSCFLRRFPHACVPLLPPQRKGIQNRVVGPPSRGSSQ